MLDRRILAMFLALAASAACAAPPTLSVPAGFAIEVYADDLPDARSLDRAPGGTVFVGTRKAGDVYALTDKDGDGRAEKKRVLLTGLNMPNGIAVHDGALYVAEVGRILRYPGIEAALDAPPRPQVVRDDLPTDTHHGWRYIAFSPDRKLYLALGAPCNVCEPPKFARDGAPLEAASITRMNPDGSDWEVAARGVRNSVGFDFEPGSGKLWFTDNGRDWMGDERPDCELNRLDEVGEHFGFPRCHSGEHLDPEFAAGRACKDFTAPQAKLGPHTAPLGLRFYTGTAFPGEYRGAIFVARHGSWNRSRKSGYTVEVLKRKGGKLQPPETFVSGFLSGEKVLGRPVDLEVLPDGSLLLSDDHGGRLWRVSWRGAP